MTFSHTQIANYLRCPRSYRHRYLDGWREKETRAAMIFGRCFEKALEFYFCDNDCGGTHREWGAFRDTPFDYKKERVGTGWCIKVCISWSGLLRKIVFMLPSHIKICKSKWCGSYRMQINLLPTSTPSVISMAPIV
jgi:hypothetical protein